MKNPAIVTFMRMLQIRNGKDKKDKNSNGGKNLLGKLKETIKN